MSFFFPQRGTSAWNKAEETTLQLSQCRAELELAKTDLTATLAKTEEKDASIVAVSEERDAAHREIERTEGLASEEIYRLKGDLEKMQAACDDKVGLFFEATP